MYGKNTLSKVIGEEVRKTFIIDEVVELHDGL